MPRSTVAAAHRGSDDHTGRASKVASASDLDNRGLGRAHAASARDAAGWLLWRDQIAHRRASTLIRHMLHHGLNSSKGIGAGMLAGAVDEHYSHLTPEMLSEAYHNGTPTSRAALARRFHLEGTGLIERMMPQEPPVVRP
jgi:hypothetical protein